MTRSKYGNRPTTVDGHAFASKAEARRYRELRLLEAAGEIRDLVLQPRFELQAGFEYRGRRVLPITYVADFQYWDRRTGERVIEDVKGHRTEAYRIKAKLFVRLCREQHGWRFEEVEA